MIDDVFAYFNVTVPYFYGILGHFLGILPISELQRLVRSNGLQGLWWFRRANSVGID